MATGRIAWAIPGDEEPSVVAHAGDAHDGWRHL
jgi:hypothetical protein